jgi:hypothetical protein
LSKNCDGYGKVFAAGVIRAGSEKMSAVRKIEPNPQPKVFHATMRVTRTEEWWIEAETEEEARALLASGQGHRAALGERVHIELEELIAD